MNTYLVVNTRAFSIKADYYRIEGAGCLTFYKKKGEAFIPFLTLNQDNWLKVELDA